MKTHCFSTGLFLIDLCKQLYKLLRLSQSHCYLAKWLTRTSFSGCESRSEIKFFMLANVEGLFQHYATFQSLNFKEQKSVRGRRGRLRNFLALCDSPKKMKKFFLLTIFGFSRFSVSEHRFPSLEVDLFDFFFHDEQMRVFQYLWK